MDRFLEGVPPLANRLKRRRPNPADRSEAKNAPKDVNEDRAAMKVKNDDSCRKDEP